MNDLAPQLADIVSRIREHLKRTSVQHVANVTGLSCSHLSKLRTEAGNPSLKTLRILARYIDDHPDPVKLKPGRQPQPSAPWETKT